MPRLNKERQEKLEPVRTVYALQELSKLGFSPMYYEQCITFLYKDNMISLWPYSGWFSGKGVKAGRGFENLLKQLK